MLIFYFINNKYKYIIIIILIILLLNILLYYFLTYTYNGSFKEIKNYLKDCFSSNSNHSKSLFIKRNNPKISIIIPTFNGEIYLKHSVRSIQNQNFSDIEIIIIDDNSRDNSIEIINELMREDQRIKLIKNNLNKGTLYSKTKGVLNAKGKYIMTLDHDDLYTKKYVFSKLYNEAETDNLDFIGFASITSSIDLKRLKKSNFINYFKTSIIKKPNIQKRFLGFGGEQSCPFLCHYFIKRQLFLKVIKLLGDELINRNIDSHDDTILMFLISRNALSFKHLKEIFYIILIWPKEYSSSLTFQKKVKMLEREKKKCFSYLTFCEILLLFTENNAQDKKIASNHFLYWYMKKGKCHYKNGFINDTLKITNLFLKNPYISRNSKKEMIFNLKAINMHNAL